MKTSGKILNDTNQSKYDYIMAQINEAKQYNQKRVTIKLEQMSKPVIKLLMENGFDVHEERDHYKKKGKKKYSYFIRGYEISWEKAQKDRKGSYGYIYIFHFEED